MKNKIMVIILFFSILSIAYPLDKEPYLEILIKKALQNNLTISRIDSLIKSSISKDISTGSLPDPSLSFSYLTEPVYTRSGPQQYVISLTQNFPGGKKLYLKKKITQLDLEVTKVKRTEIKNLIIMETTLNWLDLVLNNQNLKITSEHL